MKHNIAERWVAELRSGRHEQGSGYLDRGDKRCCLGVLCYLAIEDGVIPPPIERYVDENTGDTILGFGEQGASADLPVEVRDWAGMETAYGKYTDDFDNKLDALDSLNDTLADDDLTHLYPFTVIADVIEAYVDVL